jgi:CDP-diacylglycerol--serine O-phosphatidyltransferase
MFIGKYNKSVIITYLGVVISLIGSYKALMDNNIRIALLCLIIAGICDLFDGMYARKCKRTEEEKNFGIQIDSLSDMIDFVLLPVSIFYALGLNEWYHVVIYIFYTLAAITRLGYFNISVNGKSNEPVKYYQGLPVTYVALILPITWLLLLIMNDNLFSIIYTFIITTISFLFILNIKVIKPRGIFYVIFPLLALILIFILLFIGV